VRCPEREFRRRARGSSDVARPAAGGFLTSRKVRQENARCSVPQGTEIYSPPRRTKVAKASPVGDNQASRPNRPPNAAYPRGRCLQRSGEGAEQGRGGERAGAILSFHPSDRSGSGSSAMTIGSAEPDQAVPAAAGKAADREVCGRIRSMRFGA